VASATFGTQPETPVREGLTLGPSLRRLIVVFVGGFALAALSTVGLVVLAGGWQAAVGASAVTSVVLLVLFFNPQLVLGIGRADAA
jgi:hypothetical protein